MVISVEVGEFLQPKTISPKVFKYLKKFSEKLSPQERVVILTFNEYPFSLFAELNDDGYGINGEKLPSHVIVPCIRFVYDRRFHFLGSLFFYSDYMEENQAKFSKDISECIKLYILALRNVDLQVVATVSPYTDIFSGAIKILSLIPHLDQHFGAIYYDVGDMMNIVHIHDPTHAEQGMRRLLFKNDLCYKFQSNYYRASEFYIINSYRGKSKKDFIPPQDHRVGFDLQVCRNIEKCRERGLLPAEATGTSLFVHLCQLIFQQLYQNTEKSKYFINDETSLNPSIQFLLSIDILKREKSHLESSGTSNSKEVEQKKSKTVRNLKDIDNCINTHNPHNETRRITTPPGFPSLSNQSAGQKKKKRKKNSRKTSEVEKEFINAPITASHVTADQIIETNKTELINSAITEVKDEKNSTQISPPDVNEIKVNSKRKNRRRNKTENIPEVRFKPEETSSISTSTLEGSTIYENKTITSREEHQISNRDVNPSFKVDSKKQDKIDDLSKIDKDQIENKHSNNFNNFGCMENKKEQHKMVEQEYNLKQTENDESTNNRKCRNKKRKQKDSESLNINHNTNDIEKTPVPTDAFQHEDIHEGLEEREDLSKKIGVIDNTLDSSEVTTEHYENAEGNKCQMNGLNSQLLEENIINFKTETSANENLERETTVSELSMQPQEIPATGTKRSRTPIDLEISEALIMLSGQAMTREKINEPSILGEISNMKTSTDQSKSDALINEENVKSQLLMSANQGDNNVDEVSTKVKGRNSYISLKDLRSALSEIGIVDENEDTLEEIGNTAQVTAENGELSKSENDTKTTSLPEKDLDNICTNPCDDNIQIVEVLDFFEDLEKENLNKIEASAGKTKKDENYDSCMIRKLELDLMTNERDGTSTLSDTDLMLEDCTSTNEESEIPTHDIKSDKTQTGTRDTSKSDIEKTNYETHKIPHLVGNPESKASNIYENEHNADRDNNDSNEIPDQCESSKSAIFKFKKMSSTKAKEGKNDDEADKFPEGVIENDTVNYEESTVLDIKQMIESETGHMMSERNENILVEDSVTKGKGADNFDDEICDIPDLINESASTVSDVEIISDTNANIDNFEIPELLEDSESNSSMVEGHTKINKTDQYFSPFLVNDDSNGHGSIQNTESLGRSCRYNEMKNMVPDLFYDEKHLYLYEEMLERENDKLFDDTENDYNPCEDISYFASNENITEEGKLSSVGSEHIKVSGNSSTNQISTENLQKQASINKTDQPKEILVIENVLSSIKTSNNESSSGATKKIEHHLDRLKTPGYDDGSDKENTDVNEKVLGLSEINPHLTNFAEKFAKDQVNIDDIKHITQAITSISEKSTMRKDSDSFKPIDIIRNDTTELLVRNYLTTDQFEQILGSDADKDASFVSGAVDKTHKDRVPQNSSNQRKKSNSPRRHEPPKVEKGLIKISWKDSNTVGFEKVEADSVKIPAKDPFKITDLREIEDKAIGKSTGEDGKEQAGSDCSTKPVSQSEMCGMNDQVKGFIDSFDRNGSKNSTPQEKQINSDGSQETGAIKKTYQIRNSTEGIDDLKTWINFKQVVNRFARFLRQVSRWFILPYSDNELLEKMEEICIEFFITRRMKKEEDAGKIYTILFNDFVGKTYKAPELIAEIHSAIQDIDPLVIADRQVRDEFGGYALKPEEKIIRNLWIQNINGIRWLFGLLRSNNYDELSPDLFKTQHVLDVMMHVMENGNDPFSFGADDDCLPLDIKECFDNLNPQGSVLLVE